MPVAEEIMIRNVVTFRPDDELFKVSKTFSEHGISGAPVVDENGKVVGIISEHDIIKLGEKHPNMMAPLRHHLPLTLDLAVDDYDLKNVVEAVKEIRNKKVENVMTKKVFTASPKTGLGEIARIMNKHEINRVPVVDENKKLLGLVTRDDVVRAFWEDQKD